MKHPLLLSAFIAMMIGNVAHAMDTTYMCRLDADTTISILIESGTENGVGEISLSSPHEQGQMGWHNSNNRGNQSYCRNVRMPSNAFVMTEALDASTYVFAFPNSVFQAPQRAFQLDLIDDTDSDGHGCESGTIACYAQ